MKGQVVIESIVAIAFVSAILFLSSLIWSETKRALIQKSDDSIQHAKSDDRRSHAEFKEMSARLLNQFKVEQIGDRSYLSLENEGVQVCIKNCGKILEDWIKKN
jgi:hypothetical protein